MKSFKKRVTSCHSSIFSKPSASALAPLKAARRIRGSIPFTPMTAPPPAQHHSNTLSKFADNTPVVGLSGVEVESAYVDKVEQLTVWCWDNNLLLSKTKTKELIVDLRKKNLDSQLLFFSRVLNSAKLVIKAQQRLCWEFCHCSIESILTYSLCVWFSSCTVARKKALQGVIKNAQNIPSCPLPSLQLHTSRCLREAQNVLQDSSHPSSNPSKLLLSGRQYRSLKARTNGQKK